MRSCDEESEETAPMLEAFPASAKHVFSPSRQTGMLRKFINSEDTSSDRQANQQSAGESSLLGGRSSGESQQAIRRLYPTENK